MSASLSASRTCSGPETISTTRADAAAAALGSVAAVSIGKGGGAAARPAITRAGPAGQTGEAGGGSQETAALLLARPCLAGPWYGIEFEPVTDQFIAKLVGDDLLQFFDLLVAKFDDAAAL